MVDSLELALPKGNVTTEPVISSRRGRIIVRIMVNRARKALEDHTKFENTVQFLTKLMIALGDRDSDSARAERAEIAKYIRAKPVAVLRIEVRGRMTNHALRWEEGDMRFVVVACP